MMIFVVDRDVDPFAKVGNQPFASRCEQDDDGDGR
jgi:hypothetical protein